MYKKYNCGDKDCYECNPPKIEQDDLGLQLWKEWFEWDGDPLVVDDYGRVTCFFCVEDDPNHSKDCIFVKAKQLVYNEDK